MNDLLFEVEYQLTEADFMQAQRRVYMRNFRWLIGAALLALPIGLHEQIVNADRTSFVLICSVLTFLYLLIFFLFLLPRRSRRLFRESKSLQHPMRIRMSADQAEFLHVSGEFRLPWRDVHKWDEYAGLLSLSLNSATMMLIPLANMDPSALNYARNRLAESGLPQRGKARRT